MESTTAANQRALWTGLHEVTVSTAQTTEPKAKA